MGHQNIKNYENIKFIRLTEAKKEIFLFGGENMEN